MRLETFRLQHLSWVRNITLSIWLLLCWGLTFSTAYATSEPGTRPVMPVFVESRVEVFRMPGPPPEDYQYLAQHVRGADHQERDEYYRRWQAFVADTLQCDQEGKVWWFMSLASSAINTWMQAAHADVLESLVLDDPACAVRGMQDIGMAASLFINTYLMNPSHHSIQELDAALRTVFDRSEFEIFAASYRQQFEQRESRIAAQQAAREARAERERREYWHRLRDRRFYNDAHDDFILRWNALVSELSCDHPEQLRLLLDTARLFSADEYLHRVAGEVIADLAVNHSDCLLGVMDKAHGVQEIIDLYLVNTSRARDIYYALFDVKEDFTRVWGRYIERVYWHMIRGAELGIEDIVIALYPSHYKSFADGRVYMPMPYDYSVENMERLEQLWQAAPDGELRDTHDHPIKIFPLTELAFMRRDEYDKVYLLSMSLDGVAFLPARVVEAAIAPWGCDAPLPLLVLEPDRHPAWLKPSGTFPVHGIALGLPEDLAVPQLESARWSENYIYHGSLYWEQIGRKYDFRYTHAYVDLEFSLVDAHNLMSYRVHGFPSCH